MNINNIKSGMVIKNYKELCTLLEIPVKNGKSKVLQLKDINRYLSFTREGNKYIITEVYNQQLPKPIRKGNNRIFVDDFKGLMIYMMYNNNHKGQIYLSKSAMYRAMELVNENYFIGRENIPRLSKVISLPQEAIYEFYDNNSTKLRDTIERNLRKLRNESLLMFETVTSVAIYEKTPSLDFYGRTILTPTGEVVYKTDVVHRQSSKEEKQLILKIENQVLKDMHLPSQQAVFLAGKWRTFKKEVESRLKKSGSNIMYYYNSFCITWDKDVVEDTYNSMYLDTEELCSNMNKNIMKSISKTSKTKHTKAKNNNFAKSNSFARTTYQKSDTYVQDQEHLSTILIDTNAECIKHKLIR